MTRESKSKRKSCILSLHIPLCYCHASHVLDGVRKKFLPVRRFVNFMVAIPEQRSRSVLRDLQAIYTHIIRGCSRRNRARTAGGHSFRAGRLDNTRTVMHLITIRRIEWQPQTYFSNIKRAVIREIGYYHDTRYVC